MAFTVSPKPLDSLKSGRTRMLLAVAAVLCLVVVGYYGWRIYAGYVASLDERIEATRSQYEKLIRLVQNSNEYEELNRVLGKFEQELTQKRFITGSTLPIAEARFQTLVNDLGAAADINIRSTKVLPHSTEGNIVLLNLSISARGEIGAIKDFLQTMVASESLILFKEIEIKQISTREKQFYYFNAKVSAVHAIEAIS